MSNYVIYSAKLSSAQSRTVNSLGWEAHIWGPSYLDIKLGFTRSKNKDGNNNEVMAHLFTLDHFGIYHKGYEIDIDQPELTNFEELEVIFEAGNIHPDHQDVKRFKKYDRIPSISVGDLAFLDDYSKGWICQDIGWLELPAALCEYWSVKNITIDRVIRSQRETELKNHLGANYKEISIECSNEELRS